MCDTDNVLCILSMQSVLVVEQLEVVFFHSKFSTLLECDNSLYLLSILIIDRLLEKLQLLDSYWIFSVCLNDSLILKKTYKRPKQCVKQKDTTCAFKVLNGRKRPARATFHSVCKKRHMRATRAQAFLKPIQEL